MFNNCKKKVKKEKGIREYLGKKKLIMLKVGCFIRSIYFICFLVALISTVIFILVSNYCYFNDVLNNVFNGIYTGVISSVVLTVFIDIYIDKCNLNHKCSILYNLIFRFDDFKRICLKDSHSLTKFSNKDKVKWSFVNLSALMEELTSVYYYHLQDLSIDEIHVSRHAVTLYHMLKNLFGAEKMNSYDIHSKAFDIQINEILELESDSVFKCLNTLKEVLCDIDKLEYLLYFDGVYKEKTVEPILEGMLDSYE